MEERGGEEKVGNLVNRLVANVDTFALYNLLRKIQALVCAARGAWAFAREPDSSPIRSPYHRISPRLDLFTNARSAGRRREHCLKPEQFVGREREDIERDLESRRCTIVAPIVKDGRYISIEIVGNHLIVSESYRNVTN